MRIAHSVCKEAFSQKVHKVHTFESKGSSAARHSICASRVPEPAAVPFALRAFQSLRAFQIVPSGSNSASRAPEAEAESAKQPLLGSLGACSKIRFRW